MTGEADLLQPEAPSFKPPFLLVSFILLALANLPYLWAEIMTPEGRYNVGLVYYYQYEDACSYFAKMRLGAEGRWLYHNRFTTEPHRPVVLFPFYILLGHFARVAGLGLVAVYHLARILASAALLAALARLLKAAKLSPAAQTAAFILAVAGQGFGWTYFLPGKHPIPLEYWLTEAFTLQTLMHHPHLTLATLCLLLAWTDLILYATGQAGRAALARIALAGFALGWAHPRILLPLLLVGAAAGALSAARGLASLRKSALALAVALLAGAPPAVWMYFSALSEPLIARWAETATPSPPTVKVLYAYGFLSPLALAGAVLAWKSRSPWGAFLVAWFTLGAVVPYLPAVAQRRFFQGFNIPLGILAGWWIADAALPWARRFADSRLRASAVAAIAALLAAFFLSPLVYLWTGARQSLKGYYLPYAAVQRERSFAALRAAAKPDDVVLCAPMSGIFLPGQAGVRVVSGHWAETIDSNAKFGEVHEFYSGETTPERRLELIRRHDVKFLYVSHWEIELGRYNPAADAALWQPVWRDPPLALYALAPGVSSAAAAAPGDTSAPESIPETSPR